MPASFIGGGRAGQNSLLFAIAVLDVGMREEVGRLFLIEFDQALASERHVRRRMTRSNLIGLHSRLFDSFGILAMILLVLIFLVSFKRWSYRGNLVD